MLKTEFIVPFNSLGSLEATLICFGDSSLHCYVPECLEKKKKNSSVNSGRCKFWLCIAEFQSLCMRSATVDAFLPTPGLFSLS